MTRYTLLFLGLVMMPLIGFAQGTTSSSISGEVVDEDGEVLPGANIQAVHEPSGTTYGTTSRADGRYNLRNLRSGGPYSIQVSFVGYTTERVEDINLDLGEELDYDFVLEAGEEELGEITVLGTRDRIFNKDRTGAKTNISTQELDNTPTISRNITDYNRLIPQSSGGNSFAGRNDRYNNILIDGATLNDVFGLGDATPGSSAGAEPISLDAIQELNVDIAPFDVTNNNFTGGQLNAITRSGTNQYEGSVYYQGRNENFVGELPGGDDYPEFGESFTGFRVGGPIIEDELFFFVSGEFKRRTDPLNTGIQGSNATNIFPVGSSELNEIIDIAQSEYGYDPGTYDLISQEQDNNKFLAKLDWNINDVHRLTFRHNYVNAVDDDGISRGQESFDLSNRQYVFRSKQNSSVAELRSNFSNQLSNEARLVYTRIRDQRDVEAEQFPQVSINVQDDLFVNMGIDRFSQANRLDQDLIEFTNNLTYLRGDHEFTFGTSNQLFFFENLFIQDYYAAYEFASIDDFRNGDPNDYKFSYSLVEGEDQPTAEFSGLQFGLYAQDKWSLNDFFTLTYGLRVDLPVFPEKPLANPDVPDAFPGYRTDSAPSGNVLWSPRVGFNYDMGKDEYNTQFRGGIGIFSGSPPYVWISNQYGNTGANFGRVDVSGDDAPDFVASGDPADHPRPGDGSGLDPVETTEINLADEDFKFPQTLRTNLAVDQQLPWGVVGTLEGIYSNSINEVVYDNINLEQQGTAVGGRPLYGTAGLFTGPDRVDPRFTNAILLKNTHKGYEYSLTGQLQKQTDFGLNTNVSYTFNEAKSVINATSSRAISNWQFNENKDINNPELGRSDFQVRHRILANVSYTKTWSERFQTTFSVIYEGSSGRPYSWIYFGDANADGESFNDLIYVPESQDDVVFSGDASPEAQWEALDEFISSEPSLNEYRGEIVDRHTAQQPWRNVLDLRINQRIKTFEGQTLELTANLFNALNIINSDWGRIESVQFQNETLLSFYGYDEQGRPIIEFDPEYEKGDAFNVSDLASRWQAQLGIRYSF